MNKIINDQLKWAVKFLENTTSESLVWAAPMYNT
jgi:hypothetical protein